MYLTLTVLFFAIGAVTVWLVRKTFFVSVPRLPFPHIKFEDGDNSPKRYVRDLTKLIGIGYEKYGKRGIPFTLRNPTDEKRPQIIMPLKYLDEVARTPQSKLSFAEYNKQNFLLKHVGGFHQSNEASQIVRVDLNKRLNDLVPVMWEECIAAYQHKFPPCPDWRPMQPYQCLAYLVARISSRVLVGPELSANDEWCQMAIDTTLKFEVACRNVRQKYHPYLRWTAKYFDEACKILIANNDRNHQLLEPIFRKRKQSSFTNQFPDGIQWLVDLYREEGKRLRLEDLAQDQRFIMMASVHSSAATALSSLYDLLDYPAYLEQIKQEIASVRHEHNITPTTNWTRKALGSLRLLDAFMKEGQRLHTLGAITVRRAAIGNLVLKDGTVIPDGFQLSFPSQAIYHDPELYPDSETFNPGRFLELREKVDPNRWHFGSVSHDSLAFGAGFHACPGRFFSQEEVKMILIYLIEKYEFRWEDESTGRPADLVHGPEIFPNPSASVMFRERQNCRHLKIPIVQDMAWTILIPLILYSHQPVCALRGPGNAAASAADAALAKLNATVDGRLQSALPLAEPCFTNPSGSSCAQVKAGLPSAYFRTSQYAGFRHLQGEACAANSTDSCLLDGATLQSSASCQQGLVSKHFLPVTSPEDVAAAFDYARSTNRTLSIKNSGVDYSARSSRQGSLALWTRGLRHMEFHEDFVPAGCEAPPPGTKAITIGAGVSTDELYRFAHSRGLSYAGGTYVSIGSSGGWLLGGGHGPFTGSKGLGADRVLQFAIVTPDGQLRVANACQNQDLFWALRGGGAGAFGVVLNSSSVVDAEVPVTFATMKLTKTTEENRAQFMRLLVENMQQWVLDGWGAYAGPNSSILVKEGDDVAAATSAVRPITDFLHSVDGGHVNITTMPTFFDFYVNVINSSAALPTAVSRAVFTSSRLIPEAALEDTSRRQRMVEAILTMEKEGSPAALLTTTPLAFAKRQGFTDGNKNTSLTPAWYHSVFMVNHELDWRGSNSIAERRAMVAKFRNITQTWRDLVPDGGTYSNEADPWLPDFQREYWGDENYARLAKIKNKYDPDATNVLLKLPKLPFKFQLFLNYLAPPHVDNELGSRDSLVPQQFQAVQDALEAAFHHLNRMRLQQSLIKQRLHTKIPFPAKLSQCRIGLDIVWRWPTQLFAKQCRAEQPVGLDQLPGRRLDLVSHAFSAPYCSTSAKLCGEQVVMGTKPDRRTIWIAMVPLAVLPPYTSTKHGCSAGFWGCPGTLSDQNSAYPIVAVPMPSVAASSQPMPVGSLRVKSAVASTYSAYAPVSGARGFMLWTAAQTRSPI
ncbi:uncharacterized protein PpBr36_10635 [Pyricularia pennisetigena]|uniref:uncharacterized protein n=1 Tax=Pyricularia pennisetigena TaxID=1578925 RepID=UPI0011532736|nr:uncharacterized protein PpBr36_10635 [Pyricularia pennisetigena]TLS21201.1 hypothetical protein PpBr36_10635 [Pyricularia pennisetigena]